MNSLRRVSFCIVFILLPTRILAQNSTKIPLAQALERIENRYNVSFSFEEAAIATIMITPLNPNLTLKGALNRLRNSTDLEFTVLSDRFIAIVKPNIVTLNRLQELDEVIIEDYLAKGLSKNITGSVDFKTSSYNIFPGLIEPDVLQAIQQLPGILSVDERISNLNIRGGTNDQNLILYEGIRMYQNGHFFGLISAFNPFTTERVNIVKNGTSAKYGETVSGLISISGNDNIENSTTGGAGINLINADAFTRIPLSDKMQLQLSGRRSYTDLLVSTTYDAYFDRIFRDSELNTGNGNSTQLALDERFVFYDINGKFIYDIDKTSKLEVNLLNLYNSLDYNQIFSSANSPIQQQNSTLKQVSLGASAVYKKQWTDQIQTNFQAYFSHYDLDASNTDISNDQRLFQENLIEDLGLRFDISKKIDDNLKLTNGYQFNEVGVTNIEETTNPFFKSLVKEIIRTHVIYSEAELYSNSRNTYVRFGLRGNYFEKFRRVIVEPRIALNQKLFQDFRLEFLAESKSQSLTQIIDLEQDFFGIEKRRWQLSNEDNVPIVTNAQLSIGISYNKKDLLITAEGYYKKVDNISSQSQGFQNQFQFTDDIGSYATAGIDLLVNKRFQNFNAWLSYTYSTNDYTFDNLNNGNSFANTLDLRHVASASVTYSLDNLKFGFATNWHSGRPFTTVSSNQISTNSSIEYDAPNNGRLPSYFRADVSAVYNFNLYKGTRAEIGASLLNIFDRTNIINRYYILNDDNSISEINNRSLKFTPNFSFRVNF